MQRAMCQDLRCGCSRNRPAIDRNRHSRDARARAAMPRVLVHVGRARMSGRRVPLAPHTHFHPLPGAPEGCTRVEDATHAHCCRSWEWRARVREGRARQKPPRVARGRVVFVDLYQAREQGRRRLVQDQLCAARRPGPTCCSRARVWRVILPLSLSGRGARQDEPRLRRLLARARA